MSFRLLLVGLTLSCSATEKNQGIAAIVSEDVRVLSADSIVLGGTFQHPATPQRRPAFILVGGSGAQRRDGGRPELPGYQPYTDIANDITALGVAVLRFDDRGVGASGGSIQATTSTQAQDVATALQWLRARPDVDTARIGIIGHSEGGLIALIAAARDSTIRSLILLATPSRTGREIARWQRAWLVSTDESRFPRAKRDSILAAAENEAEREASHDPWMREWFDLDPRQFASRVRGDVLIVHGTADRQVPAQQADELAEVLRNAHARVDCEHLTDVDHLMLQDPDGNPRQYIRLENRSLSSEVLRVIRRWIQEHS